MNWGIHTGEYPPQQGGVADHVAQIARALADEGDGVTVFAPLSPSGSRTSGRLTVEAVPHLLSLFSQRDVARRLDSLPTDARVLSQYVPHGLGAKGLNLPVAKTLSRRAKHPLDLMVHEVAYLSPPDGKFRHRFLARVQARMARAVAARADRIFVAAMGWQTLLEKLLDRPVSAEWLPVPSNLPLKAASSAVAEVRTRCAPEGEMLIGHFSTYRDEFREYLRDVIPRLLSADPRRTFLLLGRGAHAFFGSLNGVSRDVLRRVIAVQASDPHDLVAHLVACDLVIQPFPDGVSGRRSSAMASLALGIPLLTTQGTMTEPLWIESEAVATAAASDIGDLLARAEQLLANRSERESLGRRGATLYKTRFAIEHAIRSLRRVE